MLLLCYPGCSTCQRARKWLAERGLSCEERDIKTQNPSAEELRRWHRLSALPLRRFFNTSGLAYRALALKDSLPQMDEEEQLALLSSDGMLVRRPLLIDGERVLVGFQEQEWEAELTRKA